MEAMAFAKPVINTKLKMGVPFVSLDGKTGLTVPPGDADALARAMRLLAQDEKLRQEYGRAGYERVCSEFSQQRMMRLLLEQMEQLAQEES